MSSTPQTDRRPDNREVEHEMEKPAGEGHPPRPATEPHPGRVPEETATDPATGEAKAPVRRKP